MLCERQTWPGERNRRRAARRDPIRPRRGVALLAALEDARDALIDSGHFPVVVTVEAEIRLLSRKLGFNDPEADTHGS